MRAPLAQSSPALPIPALTPGASTPSDPGRPAPAEFTEGIAEVRLDSGVPGQNTAESAAKLNRSKTKKRNMSMLTAGMQTLGLSAAARKFPKCDYPEGSDTRRLVALQVRTMP